MSDVLPFKKPNSAKEAPKTADVEIELSLAEQMAKNEENKKRVEKDRVKANRKVTHDYKLKDKKPKE